MPLRSSGFPPQWTPSGDGRDFLKVATSVGVLWLPRQVLWDPVRQQHLLPGNAWLPEHGGMLITRRLQEWACLLGIDFSFPIAQRLLGWQAGEEKLLCPKEVQRLVVRHGQVLQAAATAEVQELLARPDLEGRTAQWVPATAPRRPAAWSKEIQAVVLTALAAESPTPPAGVSPADWERVLAVRRAEAETPLSALARLGPELAPDQVLVTADGVLVRQPAKKRWGELQTACVATPQGYRFLCGTGWLFLQQLWLLILLAGGQRGGVVTFVSDGARWLREFAQEQLQRLPRREVILDWFHLVKKVKDRISRMGGSRSAKKTLRQGVVGALWRGDVDAALAQLEQYRTTAKNPEALDELQEYVRARREWLPHYQERRRQQQYIGSGHVEKLNDRLVARRQKHHGMHWNLITSEALARLKALQLNHEWDAYWTEGILPSLAAG